MSRIFKALIPLQRRLRKTTIKPYRYASSRSPHSAGYENDVNVAYHKLQEL